LPQDPNSLHQFRDRHKYYLLDFDLRYARQMHPFIMIWDNHDLAGNATNQYKGSVKAFHEFNPTNSFNSNSPDIIYRSFQYGSLATIVMTDFEIFNGLDSSSTTEMSAWGNIQRNWIKNELNQSTAKWKIIGNQKMMGRWSSQGFAPWLNLPGNGIVFDPTSWDGHTAERLDFLNFIHSNSINNVMVLSGDAHISMLQDLTPDFDADSIYNPNTGGGSWAVEFMPPSITRGNMDESGISSSASDLLTSGDYFANPQHVYAEFFSHGYGIIDIKPDSIIAELWYSPILQPSMTETFHKGFVVRNNENYWRRDAVILGQPPVYAKQNQQIKIHPNPATNKVWIDVPSDIDGTMELLTLNGTLVNIEVKKATPTCYMITLPILPDGMYILRYNELSGKLMISNKQ
jgi:alkaline phosphatase D